MPSDQGFLELEQCRQFIDKAGTTRCVQPASPQDPPRFAGHDDSGRIVLLRRFTCARGHYYDVEVEQP